MKKRVCLGSMKPGDKGVLTNSAGRRYDMKLKSVDGQIEAVVFCTDTAVPWTEPLFEDTPVEIEVPDPVEVPVLDALFLGT